jgi:hypothetical protein
MRLQLPLVNTISAHRMRTLWIVMTNRTDKAIKDAIDAIPLDDIDWDEILDQYLDSLTEEQRAFLRRKHQFVYKRPSEHPEGDRMQREYKGYL